MSTSDKENENQPPQSPEDRLEKIKKEAKEDPSQYYAQGDHGDEGITPADYEKSIPEPEKKEEEINMFKAVAFLGFGLAALAIIFILFFIRDIDERVGHVDSAVNSLETKIAPLKKEMDDRFGTVQGEIGGLREKVNNYERVTAIMELKRALVTIQEMSLGDSPQVKAKSHQVVTSIEALLQEFGVATKTPAGTVEVQEETGAPVAAPPSAPAVEAVAEPVPAAAEPAQAPAAPAEEAPAVAAPAEEEKAPAKEEAADDADDAADDEDEDDSEDDEDKKE